MNIAVVSMDDLPVDLLAVARVLGGGHRFTVYTRRTVAERRSRVKVATGVTIEHLPAGPAERLAGNAVMPHIAEFSARLRQRWAKDRPDVVHAHGWAGGLAAVAGAEGLEAPIVQAFSTTGPSRTRPGGERDRAARVRLELALGRRASAVVASCAADAAELIRLGVPRRSIAVVPYGVDVARFRRQGPAPGRGSRPRLLHVGHLGPDGGADTAIRALDGVPGAELLIAGGPRPADAEAGCDEERLRRLAKEAHVEDRVTLLGHVPHTGMARLLRGADVVLSLPVSAPKGKVVLEAMACGVPVIASGVGAHLDSVVEGVTGLLVPPQEAPVLARRARALLGDLTRRTALGFAGADRVCSRYSLERIGRELLRVYENATGHARPMEIDEVEAA